MSGKLEYLEKYSVAPSPSRDYYGLRVFDDQVTLYLWRISHGPHKTPIVRTSSFADFKQDHRLQDEIRRIFGEYLLKHVKNITFGNTTLLSLPKCLIERLIKYLTVQDIVKLSSLSHISKEIFYDNFVWETLYKKYKPLTKNRYEKLRTTTYNWKQLFQLAEIQDITNERKMLRARGNAKQSKPSQKIEASTKTNLKLENSTKPSPKIDNPMKVTNSSSKIASKIVLSESQITKRSAEIHRKKNTQNCVSKKLSDNRLADSTNEKEKIISEKKSAIVKSLQTIGQKNTKALKEQSATRLDSKRELDSKDSKRELDNKDSKRESDSKDSKRELDSKDSKRELDSKDSIGNKVSEIKSNKLQNKFKKVDGRASNASIKTAEDKLGNIKSKSSTASKVNKIEKTGARSTQGDQGKSKPRGKTKKIGQSKSTILSTNAALLNDHSAVRDDSFDLADLIEASLKNIRSPRSIFDYSFSCIEKPKSCGGDAKAQEIMRKMADHPRALKSGHAKATLDRLSEKSEPLTGKSMDSGNKTEALQDSATPKGVKASSTELKKSTQLNKNRYKVAVPEEKADHFERYGIYDKYPTPRMQENMEQRKPTPRKELDKMNVLRSLGTKTLQSKNVNSIASAEINRYELTKTINNVYKYL